MHVCDYGSTAWLGRPSRKQTGKPHCWSLSTLRDTLHCDGQPSVVACGVSLTSMTSPIDILKESHLTDMPDKPSNRLHIEALMRMSA